VFKGSAVLKFAATTVFAGAIAALLNIATATYQKRQDEKEQAEKVAVALRESIAHEAQSSRTALKAIKQALEGKLPIASFTFDSLHHQSVYNDVRPKVFTLSAPVVSATAEFDSFMVDAEKLRDYIRKRLEEQQGYIAKVPEVTLYQDLLGSLAGVGDKVVKTIDDTYPGLPPHPGSLFPN
jgi:hypothetical protein